MWAMRRNNLNSGCHLEHATHYSRALRIGDTALKFGTTAVDVEGTVIGEDGIAHWVDFSIDIAKGSVAAAKGRVAGVVRCPALCERSPLPGHRPGSPGTLYSRRTPRRHAVRGQFTRQCVPADRNKTRCYRRSKRHRVVQP